jgi:predicted RNase H-like HicB family nuclease
LLVHKEQQKIGGIMKYKVNLEKTEEGYSIWVPGLPGCWSQGKTENEALDNIKDAIESYLMTVDEIAKNKESRFVEVNYAYIARYKSSTCSKSL